MADEQSNPLGRPPLFSTAEEIQTKAEEYFTWIKGEKQMIVNAEGLQEEMWVREPEKPTITGLTLYLGFESRQSFYDYCDKGDFSYTLKRFRLRIENKYELNLHGNNPTGSIFALKNMGWKDKTETELSGGVELKQITGIEFKQG